MMIWEGWHFYVFIKKRELAQAILCRGTKANLENQLWLQIGVSGRMLSGNTGWDYIYKTCIQIRGTWSRKFKWVAEAFKFMGKRRKCSLKVKDSVTRTECGVSSIYRAISKKIPELTGLARDRLGTSSCWVAGLCSLSLISCGTQLGKRVPTPAPWQATFLAGGGNHESIAYRAPVLSWEARRGWGSGPRHWYSDPRKPAGRQTRGQSVQDWDLVCSLWQVRHGEGPWYGGDPSARGTASLT